MRQIIPFFALFACLFFYSSPSFAQNQIQTQVNQADSVIVNIQASDLAKVIPDSVFLIDVRTPAEFEEGKIAHAINMNVNEESFKDKVKDLDKNTPVYLYCRSGGRSMKAAEILKDLGFQKIYNLEGGYMNWEKKSNH